MCRYVRLSGTVYGRLVGLTRSEAMVVAGRAAGPGYELGTVVEASYGWVFYVMAVGEMMSGGYDHIVVEADTGRVIHGASGPDRWGGEGRQMPRIDELSLMRMRRDTDSISTI
jgi:hypothetical protein